MTRFPRSVSVDLPDGRSLEVTSASSAGGRPVRITPISPISPRFFDACPICGGAATEKEHIPPASIGGRVMTRTCEPCNNRLGANVESDLLDWHDGALTLPRLAADVLQGRRKTGRILYRTTPSGEWVLVLDADTDDAVLDMLDSGQVELSAFLPDENRLRLGLLKSAFLAACLRYGPLVGEAADTIRADLIAARDAATRYDVPRSRLALGLTVLRSKEGPVNNRPVVYTVAEVDGARTDGVLLGGTTFVSWSSKPRDVAEDTTPLVVHMAVGARVEGVVSSVEP